jgi:hypothetical protein
MIAAGVAVPLKWSVPRILDQQANGTCVAAGILGALDCDDATHTDPKFTSADIVPFFLTIAGHGDLPDGGAEVRDGLKAAQQAGYITGAYALLKTWAEMQDWLEHYGPIVTGEDWYSGMDTPNAKGFVTVGGTYRGGHCTYGNGDIGGLNEVNSWGVDYGDGGFFYIAPTEIPRLMNGDFEAWAIVQAAPAPPVPPAPVPTPTPTPTPVPPTPTPDVKGCLTNIFGLLDAFKGNSKKVKQAKGLVKDLLGRL